MLSLPCESAVTSVDRTALHGLFAVAADLNQVGFPESFASKGQ